MKTTKRYVKAHSGAGSGSEAFGNNPGSAKSRPAFASHGSAPDKSVATPVVGTAGGRAYGKLGK